MKTQSLHFTKELALWPTWGSTIGKEIDRIIIPLANGLGPVPRLIGERIAKVCARLSPEEQERTVIFTTGCKKYTIRGRDPRMTKSGDNIHWKTKCLLWEDQYEYYEWGDPVVMRECGILAYSIFNEWYRQFNSRQFEPLSVPICMETESCNTYQQAAFMKKLLIDSTKEGAAIDFGNLPVVVATHQYQMPRALGLFASQGYGLVEPWTVPFAGSLRAQPFWMKNSLLYQIGEGVKTHLDISRGYLDRKKLPPKIKLSN